MIVGEVEQLQQRLHRRHVIEVELELLVAQLAQGELEHGDIEAGLVGEVVVDHPDVGAGRRADGVEPPPGKALVREFLERREKNPVAGRELGLGRGADFTRAPAVQRPSLA